jgi:signal transduction histidine kinase
LERINQSAHRMSGLIEDLLRLLRVKEQRVESKTVEMHSLVSEVASEIRREHPGFRGRLILGNLPDVCGDAGLLSQVWMNLIINAFKFSQAVTAPVIEIGASQGADRVTYFVKDNGIGFDMRKSSDLWKPFSRLHGREVEGTGLGLSIVKSIVERHGGEVKATGAEGRGATFSFSLPAGLAGR